MLFSFGRYSNAIRISYWTVNFWTPGNKHSTLSVLWHCKLLQVLLACMFIHECKWPSHSLFGFNQFFPTSHFWMLSCASPQGLSSYFSFAFRPRRPHSTYLLSCSNLLKSERTLLYSAFIAQPTSLHFYWSGYHQWSLKASVDWSSPVFPRRCPSSTRRSLIIAKKWRCEGSQGVFIAVS